MRSLPVWLLAFFLLTVPPSYAQESRATMEGRVTDQQGALVPGATVQVKSEATEVSQNAKTGDDGRWSVRFLNPGSYSLTISAPGFKTFGQRGITLEVADDKEIDATLEVGTKNEVVEVTSEPPLIDTTSATSGTVIEPKTISDLPMESRIPYQLAGLSPGVQPLDQNNNVAFMWSNNAASEIRINGGRDNKSNEFLLDGMPNQNRDRVAYVPPADAVSEFRVMTNNYDAQYGRQAGGTLNVSIKSGTSNYHGNMYLYHQNSSLNANLFQSNRAGSSKPVAHYYLYGGTIGGPVFLPLFGEGEPYFYDGRHKTFFFFTFEGIRNKDPRFGVRSVPTELERQGDFSQSYTTQLIGGQRVRVPLTIYDPQTVDTRGSPSTNSNYGARLPFLGNKIPDNRISPIAKNILAFIPLPNAPSDITGNASNNFVPHSTRQNKMASTLVRVDHTFNDRNKLFATVRWNHMDEFSGDDFSDVATGGLLTRINKAIGFDYVRTLSQTRILNLRYSLNRFEEPSKSNGAGFNPAQLGFSPDLVSKMERFSFPRITGVFGGIGGGFGSYNITTYHNLNANLTQVHGKMTFHYGTDIRFLQDASGDYGNQSGAFRFTNQWTQGRYNSGGVGQGTAFASFLLGLGSTSATNEPAEFSRNANRFDSQHYYAFYLQNDWRVNRKLTLNLGLRWDFERPFQERYNRLTSVFDPTVLNPISDAAQAQYAQILAQVLAQPAKYPFGPQLAQLVPVSSFKVYGVQKFAGVNGQPRTVTNFDYREFQPRIGFAYQLTKRTVIRGGIGRFVDASLTRGGQNGFSRTTSFIASSDNGLTPYDSLANPFRNGILEPTGSSLGPLTNLGQGVNWINQDPKRAYSWEYSLHIQHQLKSWLLEAGYTHNKTYDIGWGLNQNLFGFDQWLALRAPRFDATGRPLDNVFTSETVPNPFQNLVSGSRGTSSTISIFDLLRPLKVLGDQNRDENPWGKNQYDALEAKAQKRFARGYSVIASYTFSKLFEDTSFWGPEISGPITEHKLGGEDRPHRLSFATIIELPLGRHKKYFSKMPKFADYTLGGWELTGQYTLQSGVPVVFNNPANFFFDGQDFTVSGSQQTLDRWFDTSHFFKFPGRSDPISIFPAWTGVQNLPGASYVPSSSNDPMNGVYHDFDNYVSRLPTRWAHVRASNVNELNLGLYKNFRLSESLKVQVRGEAFNALNHPRFPAPNGDPGSSSFGKVSPTQQNQARVIQLAVKLSF